MRQLIVGALLGTLLAAAAADSPWPERIARIEDMRPLAPMSIKVPKLRAKGEVRGPVVLRAHVDREGLVQRVGLLESCGSPEHDEAAMHTLRVARFEPRQENGMPVEVTLLVPMHLPIPRYPSRS